MSVVITGTVPTTRKSGAALSLSDISSIRLLRNGEEIDSQVPTTSTFTFRDTTPLTGVDDYVVRVRTTDGFTSEDSNVAEVVIAGADPAAAVTDLTATVETP